MAGTTNTYIKLARHDMAETACLLSVLKEHGWVADSGNDYDPMVLSRNIESFMRRNETAWLLLEGTIKQVRGHSTPHVSDAKRYYGTPREYLETVVEPNSH